MKNLEKQENNTAKRYKYARTKKRYWTFILYPESAPVEWEDKLINTGLQIAISPLHDKDINPTGERKKPHYHVILCYEGPTTGNNVLGLTKELNQPIPLPIDSVRGIYRYFTHKDNPEKYQYSEKDIKTLGGFDISNYADLSASDKTKIKIELTRLIKERDICEYATFMDFVIDLDKPDYFVIASSNTLYFDAYIRSKRHGKDTISPRDRLLVKNENTGQILDLETGEILTNAGKLKAK